MIEFSQFARGIATSGTIDASEVGQVRRAIFTDGLVTREEAVQLFEIERGRRAHDGDWAALFVEALTDYAIKQEPPAGYLSADTANWIMAEISKRKSPSTDAEVELVINLIEKAREVPASFAAFALRLVKDIVMYGDRPDARGRLHDGGRVTEADVDALQRILWGAGSEGLLAVSRDEAEALFAIARHSTGANNDPRFEELFAKAIGNHLIGATGRSIPALDVSLRWETEGPYKANVLRVMSETLASASKVADTAFVADAIRNARSLGADLEAANDDANRAREADIAAASVVTTGKADWLLEHVGQNGVITGPEKALLRFIAREASAIDPSLKDMLAKVAT